MQINNKTIFVLRKRKIPSKNRRVTPSYMPPESCRYRRFLGEEDDPSARAGRHNLAVKTLCASRHGAHGDETALVTHIESGGTIAEDVARRRARSGILARELAVHALHARSHGAHVDECRR